MTLEKSGNKPHFNSLLLTGSVYKRILVLMNIVPVCFTYLLNNYVFIQYPVTFHLHLCEILIPWTVQGNKSQQIL